VAQLCANCGAKVSSWTGVCPECGADPRTGKPLSRVPPAASSGEPRVRDPIAPARTATASVPVIVRVSPIVVRDYPIDLRAARPERSSRLWAALTILWIKFVALIPHFFILTFLAIAQFAVALVAQLVVAVKGEYPPGMHAFVVGVLRWQTRVSAFIFSLTDRYPPFSLKGDDAYPIDVVVERPACSNRLYALATVLVEFLAVAGAISLLI